MTPNAASRTRAVAFQGSHRTRPGRSKRQMASNPSATASATARRSEFGTSREMITAHQALFANPCVYGRVIASASKQIANVNSDNALDDSNGPLSKLAWR